MSIESTKSKRIAAIDWMRGFVMILMMLDHVSMAFDAHHFSADSAATFKGTLPGAFEFLTRWITHLCAPTFVFLAGTALAISVNSRKKRGLSPAEIDRGIIIRGLFILILDPTLVSLFSWRLTFQVLYAIGGAMICMAFLRRLSTKLLLTLSLGWIFFGELLVGQLWNPAAGNPSIPSAFTMAFYYEPFFRISYPLLPWLAIMCLGWVFGRYLNARKDPEFNGPEPIPVLLVSGVMLCLILAGMIALEKKIGVRPNGVLLVFGQTAMFFYLVHRIVLEGLAQWCGLRGFAGIGTTYVITVVFLILLYPLCRWYRQFKKDHPGGWTSVI
jgi:uncharacterized membrane protein